MNNQSLEVHLYLCGDLLWTRVQYTSIAKRVSHFAKIAYAKAVPIRGPYPPNRFNTLKPHWRTITPQRLHDVRLGLG